MALHSEEYECAFCSGRGLDPYGIMSHLSKCQVCWGKGKVKLRTPNVECKFCRGTGKQWGKRLTCSACWGKGRLYVKEPHEECPKCEGSGFDPEYKLIFYCTECRGAGQVAA